MTIINETKRIHEVLGEIRFDDGKGDSKIGTPDEVSFWLARPMGWSSDGIEVYCQAILCNLLLIP